MTSPYRDLLRVLLDRMVTLYQESAKDRGKLHEEEWGGAGGAPSILGEAEMIDEAIAGPTIAYYQRGRCEERTIPGLLTSSVYRCDVLREWLLANPDSKFAAYLICLEHVRQTLIEAIRAGGDDGVPPGDSK